MTMNTFIIVFIIVFALCMLSCLVATRDRFTHRQTFLIGLLTPFVIEVVILLGTWVVSR